MCKAVGLRNPACCPRPAPLGPELRNLLLSAVKMACPTPSCILCNHIFLQLQLKDITETVKSKSKIVEGSEFYFLL